MGGPPSDSSGAIGQQTRALGQQLWAYQADFSDRTSTDRFTQRELADFERLDILVNRSLSPANCSTAWEICFDRLGKTDFNLIF